MADQNKVAIAFEFVAGVGDFAAFAGVHIGALRQGQIDAVVLGAVGTAAVAGDDAAARGPAEASAAVLRGALARRGGDRRGVRDLVAAGGQLLSFPPAD
jgi:hypothetical protein